MYPSSWWSQRLTCVLPTSCKVSEAPLPSTLLVAAECPLPRTLGPREGGSLSLLFALPETLKLLQRLLKSPGCRKIPVLVQNKDDVIVTASNFSSER